MVRFQNFIWFLLSGFLLTGMVMSCSSTQALADKKNYQESSDEYRRKFSFELDSAEKVTRYGYYYVVSNVPGGFRVRVFHPELKTLTEEKHYSTAALTLLHGEYKSWWDDGSIREQGFYQYGRKHGIWLEKEPGQGKSASGDYYNHRKEGIWTHLDTNGMVESVYTWKDGERHGKFFLYNTAGEKVNEGLFSNDTLIAELFKTPIVNKPYLKNCDKEIYSDVYSCTDIALPQYVYTELNYPSSAKKNKVQGIAFVQWEIDTDGSVKNLRVPASVSNDIKEEILRVFSRMPDWMPGTKDGVPATMTVSMPINFSL